MIKEKNVLILYTTAICNLNCKYCFIDKNPALVEIDRMLDESFDSDYYTEFAREVFPARSQLRRVEFWGGEPTLRLDRAFRTIHNLIYIYPNLKEFFFSTNFTNVNWNEQVFSFFNLLNKFEDRQFVINIQLSLDGPKEITDEQRGKGVFDRMWAQMSKFMEEYNKHSYENLTINIFFKPTLTSPLVEKYLSTKKDIIKYYKTFEEYYSFVEEKRANKRINMDASLPNFATPGLHTKHDGEVFAEFSKNCYELEKENLEHSIFKYYKTIRVYRLNRGPAPGSGYCSCVGCGTGDGIIGLLPGRNVSNCHGAFVNLLEDYKKRAKEKKEERAIDAKLFQNEKGFFIRKYEEQEEFERCLAFSYDCKDQSRLVNMTLMIITLAISGQIDKMYVDEAKALEAAKFILQKSAVCFRDNQAATDTCVHVALGTYRLFLNGAKEWIEKD